MTGFTKGTTVQFQGTTTLEYKEWEGPIISFSGIDITITGASGHVIDGNGAAWWDGEGSNGGKTKPKFFYAHKLIDSTIEGLNIKSYPVQCYSVNGAENLSIQDATLDNSAGDELNSDGDALDHSTDAFDVGSSTSVYISGARTSRAKMTASPSTPAPTSPSPAAPAPVATVSPSARSAVAARTILRTFTSRTPPFPTRDNGVRIKAVYDATGSVKNVTYSGIALSNMAKYGIAIERDYENGSRTGTPTSGVPITGLTIEDVAGSVASNAQEVYILCASCSEWTWNGVTITGGEKSSSCEGVPIGALC